MATINSALSLITQALNNNQAALNVVANNVANAGTAGYTEEKATWQENSTVTINGVKYGQGSTMTGPVSQRDLILNQRLNQQQQMASASSTRLTALNSLQAVFTPATSSTSNSGNIGTDLTSFFSSFSSLEASPTSVAYREEVLSSATTLASDISGAAASLQSQQAALDQESSSVIIQVNALTKSIAQLNKQIAQSSSGSSDAGTLEDQRQLDLAKLSKLVGVDQVTTANNGLAITTTSGQLLVSGESSYDLSTGKSGGVTHVYLGSTDVTSSLESGGGSLGGYLTARDVDVAGAISSLDQLAYSVTSKVNALNNSGQDQAGNTSNAGNIFNQLTTVSGSALAMSVVMTDPSHIAAASSTAGAGDNSNAIAMADLANQTIVGNNTPSNYYSNFVSTLGAAVSTVETQSNAQSASVTQLQTLVDSTSAVNLNDEASSLTLLERSYQAASQVFAILNSLMASALNLGSQTTVSG